MLRQADLAMGLRAKVLVATDEFFRLQRAIGVVSLDPAIGLKLGSEERTELYSDPKICERISGCK